MEDLISVIVPIYNSERYLRDCIESILLQTYSCFEIILIDDGSCDGSAEICRSICRNDRRVRLICHEHKGVSAARNRGIEDAKGKYVFFVDSDDVIHPWLLETLYKLLEKTHAVIATEGYQYLKEGLHYGKGIWNTTIVKVQRSYYLNYEEAIHRLSSADRTTMLYAIGGKLILREALRKIRFHEELSHAEDTMFIYQLLNSGADVSVLCCKWYGYRMKEYAVSLHSIRASKSENKVTKYICGQEIKNGRMNNAVCWEEYRVDRIIQLYIAGRNSGNKRLVRHAKKMVYIERKSLIFRRIGWYRRIGIVVVFGCYPIYHIMYILLRKLVERK